MRSDILFNRYQFFSDVDDIGLGFRLSSKTVETLILIS